MRGTNPKPGRSKGAPFLFCAHCGVFLQIELIALSRVVPPSSRAWRLPHQSIPQEHLEKVLQAMRSRVAAHLLLGNHRSKALRFYWRFNGERPET
jgi:hypothetical protein